MFWVNFYSMHSTSQHCPCVLNTATNKPKPLLARPLLPSYLWYVMTETILPVAEQAKLSERPHRSFTPDEAAHALSLYDGVDECVKVVVRSGGRGDAACARLHSGLSWERKWQELDSRIHIGADGSE